MNGSGKRRPRGRRSCFWLSGIPAPRIVAGMGRTDDALELAEETLAQLELGNTALAPIVMRCMRLARLLDNVQVEKWMRLELRGYSDDVHDGEPWAGYAEWSGRRASEDKDGNHFYWIAPIEVVDAELQVAKKDLDALQLPSFSVTDEAQATYNPWPTKTEKLVNLVLTKRAAKAATVTQWTRVTACLRGSIQQWLSATAVNLRYREVIETAFERARAAFDAFLLERAPEVARKLAAAYRRAYSEDSEEWSQALTSCRRAIKSLADVLCPATTEQPAGHPLTDEHYRNRLVQFASEQLSSGSQREMLQAEIDLVVSRVEALDGLASKGVHSEVDESDLELAVVHTYLLAGELLTLLPEEERTQPVTPEADDQAVGQGLATDSTPSRLHRPAEQLGASVVFDRIHPDDSTLYASDYLGLTDR